MIRNKSFSQSAILYLVATPIGNLKEISERAKEVLSAVDFIASEDTRTTLKLLNLWQIKKPMISCHEHNESEAADKIVNLLKEGKSVAMTSDAGYPGISDPGSRLVKKAIENGLPISVINGANAFLPALLASGLDTDHFYFHGFLDAKKSARIKELEALRTYPMTIIFYESPHRILKTLEDILFVFGNRKGVLVREISKIHEEYIRGTLDELVTLSAGSLKGEMVLVIDGCKEIKTSSEEEVNNLINDLINQGLSIKDIAKQASQKLDISKNEAYRIAMELTKRS